MVANPNSELVFDFPEPTPRFEFDSPTKAAAKNNDAANSAQLKRSKRFGKFVKSKIGGKSSNDIANSSPSKASVVSGSTRSTESLNASLDSTLDSGKTLAATGSGDIAGGPNSGYAIPHFDLQQAPAKLNLPSRASPQTSKHRRNPSVGSGYISEVSEWSEFSFDRVTVTTNQSGVTGKSSNLSWGFVDDNVLRAVGVAGGGQNEGEGFTPYTGEAGAKTAGAKTTVSKGHKKKTSTSTFDNVSVSDDELDHIPVSGIVGASGQSVISEMSERTGAGGNSAVKALLKEGMDSLRAKATEAKEDSPGRETRTQLLRQISHAASGELSEKADQPSRTAPSTVPSSTMSIGMAGRNFLTGVKDTYKQFKFSHNDGKKEKGSILQSIVEDVQFCGLYFCGIDTTHDESGGKYEDALKAKKEDRKREMDDTFLGKVISCDGCGTEW
ncbi:hypothetical protein ACHAXT_005023 [Thalassiosira profunda]